MVYQLGTKNKAIAIVKEIFGEKGTGVLVGVIEVGYRGETFLGLGLQTEAGDFYTHHDRLFKNFSARFMWVRVTLSSDGALLHMEECEPWTGEQFSGANSRTAALITRTPG